MAECYWISTYTDRHSACVQPPSLWDCSLLKEQQSLITPNAPNQPNFRMKIKFRNTTALSAAGVNRRSHEHGTAGFFASKLIRSWPYRTREFLTDSLYVASPLPPSQDDQIFLGNTTDNNTAPFDGENTPFTMSFEEPVISHALRLKKRIFRRLQNLTNPFPDLTAIIPLPNGNGTAAAANLLPFPSNQPLRLYNRGLLSEHYGFYIYFDRSIFLKSILPKTALSSSGEVPEDGSGGAEKNTATVRCTWAQTRFVVHIWTNKMSGASLLYQSVGLADTNTKSTNDSRPPGSFPYPISIELDRHGGDITKKLIYCYNLDPSQRILSEQKKVQLENRTVGGEGLINPALGPFGHVNISRADGGPGGIDGGTGGCRCQWRNFNA